MKTRVDYGKAAPGSVQAMYQLETYVRESGLERPLLELVKTRVSQLNGVVVLLLFVLFHVSRFHPPGRESRRPSWSTPPGSSARRGRSTTSVR